MIPRLQLIEIAEQTWCPPAVRNGLTDYLQYAIDQTRPYAPAAPLIEQMLETAKGSEHEKRVVDLGAGAGGPWRSLSQDVFSDLRIVLTDRFPNHEAFQHLAQETDNRITGDTRSISAHAVPPDLKGIRTIFSAFHHFSPKHARSILEDAVQAGAPIAVFEATRRNIATILLTCLTPLLVLLITPKIRPFRWSRLLLTYIIPVIPLVVLFDGIVSCLRTYTAEEMISITKSLSNDYEWQSGSIGKGPVPVTFLIGWKRN